MLNKVCCLLDKNIIYFGFLSFLLSVIVHLILGSKIEIDNLLTVSLAVSGGLWSLLSIEQSKVKELRGEYIKNLKELEVSCLESIYLSGSIFLSMIKFDVVEDSLRHDKFIEIVDQMHILDKKNAHFKYLMINISNNEKNDKNFRFLDLCMSKRMEIIRKYFDLLSNNSLKLERKDEKDMNSLVTVTMKEMNSVFSEKEVGFEDFSESYLFTKIVCFTIIMTFVFAVLLKAILA